MITPSERDCKPAEAWLLTLQPLHVQAITALLRLAPSTALLQVRDEQGHTLSEEEVPSALIQRGDLLKVKLPTWPLPAHQSGAPLTAPMSCPKVIDGACNEHLCTIRAPWAHPHWSDMPASWAWRQRMSNGVIFDQGVKSHSCHRLDGSARVCA